MTKAEETAQLVMVIIAASHFNKQSVGKTNKECAYSEVGGAVRMFITNVTLMLLMLLRCV